MHVVAWPQAGGSTVVVEATAETIHATGSNTPSADAILAFCRQYFADAFDGVSAPADGRGARSSLSARAAGTPARPW